MAGIIFFRAALLWQRGSAVRICTLADNAERAVSNASLGRSSGGIHERRAKGRRRRSRSGENQDGVNSCCGTDDKPDELLQAEASRKGKKMRRRSSKRDDPLPATEEKRTTDNADDEHGENEGKAAESGAPSLAEKIQKVVLPENVVQQAEQVAHVAEIIVEQIAAPVVEQVATAAVQVTEQVASLLSDQEDDDNNDEFDSYSTSDLPEFRGIRGLENFTVMQETSGLVTVVYDFYIYVLKKPVTEFALAMFAAPVLMSMLFTMLYLPQLQGLSFDQDAAQQWSSKQSGLDFSWGMLFHVFMFSFSLSTDLQPELVPRTPYTLVVANINALFAQLIFVFLSGAVFARLSQPSQPVRCSPVALVSPFQKTTSKKQQQQQQVSRYRVFMTRYVLVGPQPCELVDVKVDLSYKYNTMTSRGSYFRATDSLKLVRSEVAYLNHGMLVRHVIDETSPLKRRSNEMLLKEDGIFTLSVIGLERSSMQPVFHAQHYSVNDGQVIWDAEFEDMILVSKKNKRIVDHSRLSLWRKVTT